MTESRRPKGGSQPPVKDRRVWYDRWAWVILAGLGAIHLLLALWLLPSGLLEKYPAFAALASRGALSGEDASPASPLYLLIHVVLSPARVRWVQAGGALGSILLVFLVGRAIRDSLLGLISATLLALSVPLLVYGATLEPDLLLMAACLLGVWAVPRVVSGWTGPVVFGLAMGTAVGLRPTAGLIAVALLAGLLVETARHRALRRSWRRLAAAGLVTGLVGLAPTFGVRALVSSPVRGTMSPGTAFYDGNRPESIGIGVTNPWLVKAVERQEAPGQPLPDFAHVIYRRFARIAVGNEITPAEVQEYWAGRSWAYAGLKPGAFVHGIVRKVTFLLAGSEYHDVHLVRRAFVLLARLPVVRFGWLSLLGLAGMLLAMWKRRGPWWLWGYWAAGAAGLVLFSVITRYAMIFLPATALFAGFFLREGVAVRSWRSAFAIIVCLILADLPHFSPSVRMDTRVQQRVLAAHAQVEELTRRRQDLSAAMGAYVAGQSYYPFLPSIMDPRGLPFESPRLALEAAQASEQRGGENPADQYMQAVLWQKAGDCGRAMVLARRSASARFFTTDDSRFLEPNLLEAECLIGQGKKDEALQAVLASLSAHPATADGLAMALAGAESTGLPTAEASRWREELSRIHDPLSGSFALMRALRIWGETDAALAEATRLGEKIPGIAVIDYETARIHAEAGRVELAFEELQRAQASDPGLPLELAPFTAALDSLLLSAPDRREVWIAKIDQAAQAGRFQEAFEVARQAAERFGEDPEVQGLLNAMAQLASLFGNSLG